MPLPETARQLLLLDVHDANDVGKVSLVVLGVEQAALRRRGDADFGEEMPAHAVDLRQ